MKRQLKLYFLRLKVFFKKIFANKENKIAILVSSRWRNKVSDDVLLELSLLNNNIYPTLVSFDKPHNYKKYKLVIIRSIWGYEKNIQYFLDLINDIHKNHIPIINDYNIIINNYNKEKQLRLLEEYQIPHIDTTIIKENTKDIKTIISKLNEEELVIKPCISASGNNTYLISNNKDRDNVISLDDVNNKFREINKKTSLIVQPFIKEIDNGEISLIYINGTYSHAILRFPNIFNNKSSITYIKKEKLDKEIFDVANKVLGIKEYQNNLYERIDFVKINNKYYIMEIELIEPDLFIRKVYDKSVQDNILNNITKSIKDIIKK